MTRIPLKLRVRCVCERDSGSARTLSIGCVIAAQVAQHAACVRLASHTEFVRTRVVARVAASHVIAKRLKSVGFRTRSSARVRREQRQIGQHLPVISSRTRTYPSVHDVLEVHERKAFLA
jgi:hypothetical protein